MFAIINKPRIILVSMSWFTPTPTFEEAYSLIKEQLQEPTLVEWSLVAALKEILYFNDGVPFRGETYSHSTHLLFKAPHLHKAVLWANAIKIILRKKFPDGAGKNKGGIRIHYNHKKLYELLEDLGI